MKTPRALRLLLLAGLMLGSPASGQSNSSPDLPWRALPLIRDNKVDTAWSQVGWGSFVVDDGALRTEPDDRGMGLLLYTKEKLGDCQIRIVYRCEKPKSNAGIYVRLDDGILAKAGEKSPEVHRDEKTGRLSKAMLQVLEDASNKHLGAWYPVHHGYEVQIMDDTDEFHRTGAIYSLAKSAPLPPKPQTEWRTMIITLNATRIRVEVDGTLLSTFDSAAKDLPPRKKWTEPIRDIPRPTHGYIGLQNHDPGDVIWFKEISVRPLAKASTTQAAPKAATFETMWGKEGEAPGDFNIPIGIAINAADEIFISDHYNSRVQKFDADGKLLAHFPVLPNPGGITADGDLLYITHFPVARVNQTKAQDRVSVYSQKGEFIREWGSTGTGDGQLSWPGGLAVNKAGEVFVADQTNRRVQVFDREGKFLRKWGEYGVKPGQFGGNTNPKSRVGGPQFIAINQAGCIFTTEASVGRIQKFSPEGKPLLAWGTLDDKPGAFGGFFTGFNAKLIGPIGIAFDRQNRLWISAVSGRVQCFSPEGTYIGGIGDTQGTEEGQFYAPHGVAINSHNELFVVDTYNHRVQKYVITAP
ncbi:family 16 glycoside hydrolase [Brevifollis gellanilyticus]|uniref:family 16 glycoside hydrolase n=1 Tax=Brevifollis gellanilyticus TaxID=748831 RepID=UPI001C3FE972|nr:family 16 glycoside hydrolase [Brevifollis gellanilyticus]